MIIKPAALAAGLLGLFALGACGYSPYEVNSTSKLFLPEPAAARALGAARLMPDDVAFETLLGFTAAGRLDAPVRVTLFGKDYAFEQGAVLASAQVLGTEAARLAGASAILCGMPRFDAAKKLLNLTTLGLSSLVQKTASDSQICLIDSDGDDRLDRAIMAGVKYKDHAAPVMIAATPYSLVANAPMNGASHAQIRYRGKTGLIGGRISFDLTVTEEGRILPFDNVRSQIDLKSLPATVRIMGTELRVEAYDPTDGSISVTRVQGFRQASYGVHMVPSTRSMYIPIYVPR